MGLSEPDPVPSEYRAPYSSPLIAAADISLMETD
jgi:hypothetical protein